MKHVYLMSTLLVTPWLSLHAMTDEEKSTRELNCATSWLSRNQLGNALHHLYKSIHFNPKNAHAHAAIGGIQLKNDAPDKAEIAFDHAIKHDASCHYAYQMLGNYYESHNQPVEAKRVYKKAAKYGSIETEEARLARAQAYLRDKKFDEVEQLTQTTTFPNQFVFEFAHALMQAEQFERAAHYYNFLLTKIPTSLNVRFNYAHALRMQGKMEESIPHYQIYLAQEPSSAAAHYGLGEALLMCGNFLDGFAEFEWRWKRDGDSRNFSTKLWHGEDLVGKKVLVRAEYGLGDTIQFFRYVSLLKKQGATVIVEVQAPLVQLLSSHIGVDQVIPIRNNVPSIQDFDVQIPIMSLPHYFKTEQHTVPYAAGYLQAPEELVQYWKQKTAQDTNLKVGICWETSPYFASFRPAISNKTIPLDSLEQLLAVPGVTFYSLQKIDGLQDAETLAKHPNFIMFDNFDEDHGRFMDTAALATVLDLVICADTSVAHLSAALATPTWILLPYVADWRWMQKRNDTPWYSSAQLFRQAEPENWDHTIETLIAKLRKICEDRKKKKSITAEVSIGELIDKLTILNIKNERIRNEAQLINVRTELASLNRTKNTLLAPSFEVESLTDELQKTNNVLWEIEDAIRTKEQNHEFDEEFINIARGVYRNNARRCALKQEINKALNSHLIEEKCYTGNI